jgi:charged multivesicular body protein 4
MSWMGWFGGRTNDHKESARNAIVELRSQLLMLEKREDHIQKQIDEETRKAKANATSNQRCRCRFPRFSFSQSWWSW